MTVIIPLYNGADSVERTVRSVLRQDYPTLEVLLVDDGSRDTSVSVARALARADGRVRLVELPENGGLAHALNVGLREPGGPFVLLLHQDCALRGDGWVTRAMGLLSGSDAAGLAGLPFHDVAAMTPLERVFWVIRAHTDAAPTSRRAPRLALFSENKCDIFRREALLAIGGFDEAFRTGGEDQLLALRLEEAGKRLLSDPELRFDLTLGADRHLGAGLRKEMRYGEQMRTVLRRTRGRAARRTATGAIDPRLLHRAVGLGWVITSLTLTGVAFVLRSPTIGVLAAIPVAVRAVQLSARGVRERRPYLLRGRDILGVVGLGLVMDVAYAIGLVTPGPRAAPASAGSNHRPGDGAPDPAAASSGGPRGSP